MNKSTIKYIAALLLFGSNGIIASMINLNSYEIVMLRTLIGSIFLITFYLIKYKSFSFYENKRSFIFLILSGISMGGSWLFLYEAYKLIGISLASLGYYCGPIFVMVLSPLLFKEHFTKQKIISFFIALVGVVLVNGNAVSESHAGFGIFCALMSAIMYCSMVSFNKKAEEITGMENATLQLTIAFLAVFIFVICKQGFHLQIQASDIAPLLFLGLVNTGIGCLLYFSSIGNINVQTVAILGYIEPLSAVIFAFVFLNEHFSLLQTFGALLIISGAILAETKLIPEK